MRPQQQALHCGVPKPAPPGSPVEHVDEERPAHRHQQQDQAVAARLARVADVPRMQGQQPGRGHARGGEPDPLQEPRRRRDRRDSCHVYGQPDGALVREPELGPRERAPDGQRGARERALGHVVVRFPVVPEGVPPLERLEADLARRTRDVGPVDVAADAVLLVVPPAEAEARPGEQGARGDGAGHARHEPGAPAGRREVAALARIGGAEPAPQRREHRSAKECIARGGPPAPGTRVVDGADRLALTHSLGDALVPRMGAEREEEQQGGQHGPEPDRGAERPRIRRARPPDGVAEVGVRPAGARHATAGCTRCAAPRKRPRLTAARCVPRRRRAARDRSAGRAPRAPAA